MSYEKRKNSELLVLVKAKDLGNYIFTILQLIKSNSGKNTKGKPMWI